MLLAPCDYGPSTGNALLSGLQTCWFLRATSEAPILRIWYDNAYAAGVISGTFRTRSNTLLVRMAQGLVRALRANVYVFFCKVNSHSGEFLNDCADEAANHGATGSVEMWAPPPEIQQALCPFIQQALSLVLLPMPLLQLKDELARRYGFYPRAATQAQAAFRAAARVRFPRRPRAVCLVALRSQPQRRNRTVSTCQK